MALDIDKMFEKLERDLERMGEDLERSGKKMGDMFNSSDLDKRLEDFRKRGYTVKKTVRKDRHGNRTNISIAEKSFELSSFKRHLIIFLLSTIIFCFFMSVFTSFNKKPDKIQTESKPPAIEERVDTGDKVKL